LDLNDMGRAGRWRVSVDDLGSLIQERELGATETESDIDLPRCQERVDMLSGPFNAGEVNVGLNAELPMIEAVVDAVGCAFNGRGVLERRSVGGRGGIG